MKIESTEVKLMALLTRSLAAGAAAAVALGTGGAILAPANAGSGPGHGRHDHHHHGNAGFALTRSAAATLHKYDVAVTVADNVRADHHAFLRGAVVFDGDATTRWTNIRVNERTNRITAIVNGDREAVLRFRGSCSGDGNNRTTHHGSPVLRLTSAGATSIDHAAGADAFDAGDAFATAAHR
jgi:hypothetical protein